MGPLGDMLGNMTIDCLGTVDDNCVASRTKRTTRSSSEHLWHESETDVTSTLELVKEQTDLTLLARLLTRALSTHTHTHRACVRWRARVVVL